MAYFPLFVNLEGKTVLVIGGGTVAARRVNSLLEFGCEIHVVSPELGETMEQLWRQEKVGWTQGIYEKKYLTGRERPVFVLAAANEDVNFQVVKDCREAGLPVNDSAKKEHCDFYFPGLIKDGDVVIGVTTGGSDHKLAAALSAKIRELIRKTLQA